MLRVMTFLTLASLASLAQAQDGAFVLGSDVYQAGRLVTLNAEGRDDLFVAGERLIVSGDATGSGHLAGRRVEMRGALGGDLYAAGQTVRAEGAVAGDATLAAQEVTVTGAIAGDLRIFGDDLILTGPVSGSLLATGAFLRFQGTVEGDAAIAANTIEWGPDARVSGRLILFEDDPGSLQVPEWVIPAERIDRREMEGFDKDFGKPSKYMPVTGRDLWRGFVVSAIVLTAVAAAAAALAPQTMARLRRTVLGRPGRSLLAGFVTMSALTGAGILLLLTLIGALLTPLAILAAVAAGYAGYVVGAYALGVAALSALGRHDPENLRDRAIAAAVGAVAVGLIAMVPFFGWLAVLLLSLAGAGACALVLFRPRFFVSDAA
ncbi:hypothetical protein MAA8898_01789 [Maliponia aquimaris]|uniref:DUF8173 domain-containing protein n=2 Tax=Maliponia aquimaris TaxID=1673631 RepID=A0A238K916_9RHOB|nr:hypothetical protein MAA8898_01789 [Maliponia aquimaris]